MKVERITNDNNETRCFEVENRSISRSGMSKILSQIQGIEITHSPKFYDDEVFCEFTLNGHKFEVTEPYGDSSVYDVVASKPNLPELEQIAKHFESSSPIKGGDLGRNTYFLINWIVSSILITGLVGGIIWLFAR